MVPFPLRKQKRYWPPAKFKLWLKSFNNVENVYWPSDVGILTHIQPNTLRYKKKNFHSDQNKHAVLLCFNHFYADWEGFSFLIRPRLTEIKPMPISWETSLTLDRAATAVRKINPSNLKQSEVQCSYFYWRNKYILTFLCESDNNAEKAYWPFDIELMIYIHLV